MEGARTESQRLREQLTAAIDLKEASSLKDPFTAHMLAPERAEAVEVDTQLDQELLADHPSHERIEKLIALKDSFKAAHVDVAPEEAAWREEVDEAMK
jgi:hypothetical protein